LVCATTRQNNVPALLTFLNILFVRIQQKQTGLRATHVEFEGRVKAQVDFTVFQDNVDGTGHGTHVTGIAAGEKFGVAVSNEKKKM
jgi:hypothetical protein